MMTVLTSICSTHESYEVFVDVAKLIATKTARTGIYNTTTCNITRYKHRRVVGMLRRLRDTHKGIYGGGA